MLGHSGEGLQEDGFGAGKGGVVVGGVDIVFAVLCVAAVFFESGGQVEVLFQ